MGIFSRKNKKKPEASEITKKEKEVEYSFDNFTFSDLEKLKAEEFDQDFAIWWPSDEEKTFAGSMTEIHTSKIVNAIENYPSVFIGYFLFSIGSNKEFQRVLFPGEEAFFIFRGPHEQKMLVLISDKKGIQFLFAKSTPQQYREKLLNRIAMIFYSLLLNIKEQNADPDEKTLAEAKKMYLQKLEQVREKEKRSEYVDSFGLYECVATLINSLKQPQNKETENAKVEFISAPVSEEQIRKMAKEPKDVKLTIEKDGSVSGICKSCNKSIFLEDKDELLWFLCPSCVRLTFYPMGNVQRDIQFAIKDDKPFEVELYFLKEIPDGLVHPFQK